MCGRVVQSNSAGVVVAVGGGTSFFRGLQHCSSVHVCPVCGPKIRAGRSAEIERGVRRALARGWGVEFVTLTMPHDAQDRLVPMLKAMSLAWKRVLGGSSWQRDRADHGVRGTIRLLEVTNGAQGWHPHFHVLLFTGSQLTTTARAALRDSIASRWSRAIVKAGYRQIHDVHGVDIRPVYDAAGIAGYTTKVENDVDAHGVAQEMARADLKGGALERSVTPWAILSALADAWERGDELLGAWRLLWREYELATKGARMLVWGNGLKAELGVDEATDEDLAAVVPLGLVVAVLSRPEWQRVRAVRGGAVAVLDAAELMGAPGVQDLLARVIRAGP